jgi:hypothetical protein
LLRGGGRLFYHGHSSFFLEQSPQDVDDRIRRKAWCEGCLKFAQTVRQVDRTIIRCKLKVSATRMPHGITRSQKQRQKTYAIMSLSGKATKFMPKASQPIHLSKFSTLT